MTRSVTAKFHLPPQDLAAPALFPADRAGFAKWLEGLPQANLGQTAKALYGAVLELNRLQIPPAQRLQMLEILRPTLHATSSSLRRHYLNQPIQLPEQPQQVARLSHVLHEQLATGYVLVAVQTRALDKQSGFSQPQAAMATAIHRSVVEHSQNLLRDYQLYRNPYPGCWATLHQLMLFAQEIGAEQMVIADGLYGDSSVQAAYLRALLLGSCRPNQLRQDNLAKVFQQLLGWTGSVGIVPADRSGIVVNPLLDEAPVYREFTQLEPHSFGLDTSALVHQLRLLADEPEPTIVGDQQLGRELALHLAQSWSSFGTREFLRMEVNEPVNIAAGLTATHHFLSGEMEFTQLLSDNGLARLNMKDANPFLRDNAQRTEGQLPKDVWASPYEPHAGVKNVTLEILDDEIRQYSRISKQPIEAPVKKEREKFRTQTVDRINVSPGGLCIKWPPDSPLQIRTGEIAGVRENAQKNWSIAIIRWIQLIDSGPRLGLQLLSPTAAAYGARPINKTGAPGEYLRALVLPEVKQIGQPTTLIVPRLPFRTGQKVSLCHHGKETQIQLTRKILSTEAFSQFEFRRLGAGTKTQNVETATDNNNGGAFDNLWDNL